MNSVLEGVEEIVKEFNLEETDTYASGTRFVVPPDEVSRLMGYLELIQPHPTRRATYAKSGVAFGLVGSARWLISKTAGKTYIGYEELKRYLHAALGEINANN